MKRLALPLYVGAVCLFLLIPLLIVIPTAFSDGALARFPPEGLGLRWFAFLAAREDWVAAFLTSVRVALLTTMGSVAIGLLAALALVRYRVPARGPLLILLSGPIMFPSIVIGIGLLQWLVGIGIIRSVTTLALAHMLVTAPFVLRLVMLGLQGAGVTRERAARSLGASPLRAFLHVTLPTMRTSLFGAASLAFIISMADVNVAIFLSPVRSRTLPVKLFAHIEQNSDPLAAAVATVVIAFTLIALLVLDRTVGLKGAFAARGRKELS